LRNVGRARAEMRPLGAVFGDGVVEPFAREGLFERGQLAVFDSLVQPVDQRGGFGLADAQSVVGIAQGDSLFRVERRLDGLQHFSGYRSFAGLERLDDGLAGVRPAGSFPLLTSVEKKTPRAQG
jgi:hypothetical protein